MHTSRDTPKILLSLRTTVVDPNNGENSSGVHGDSVATDPAPMDRPRKLLGLYYSPLPDTLVHQISVELATCKNLTNISLTEFLTFVFDDFKDLLDSEYRNLCVDTFRLNAIDQNNELIRFYAGLPNAIQFTNLDTMLKRVILEQYTKWKSQEQYGFSTHTMMVLVKLRLNLTDEELAKRFKVEPHVVNMTMKLWLPALSQTVYQYTEDLCRVTVPRNGDPYTRVVDVVELCVEAPDNNFGKDRPLWHSRVHQPRRAVLSVRSDGYICFASDVVSVHSPTASCILMSNLAASMSNLDVAVAHPELQLAITSLGIPCSRVHDDGIALMETAADRLAGYRILSAIPQDYESFAGDIFKSCAALSNYLLSAECN